jgi:hypothetical protein
MLRIDIECIECHHNIKYGKDTSNMY